MQATDAALTINENADPTVRSDLEGALQRIASPVAHRPNGEAAALTSLLGVSLDLPVHGGRLSMGTWQVRVLLSSPIEARRSPSTYTASRPPSSVSPPQGLYLADFTGAASSTGRELVVTITVRFPATTPVCLCRVASSPHVQHLSFLWRRVCGRRRRRM